MKVLILFLGFLLSWTIGHAGVYGELEFGDDRETVTHKLQQSPLVEQTIDNTFIARTGLNGIFKCKAKISGLTCHLYFNWDQQGGLNEITLRSEKLKAEQYQTTLRKAWLDAESLFSKVYQSPTQKASYPLEAAFEEHQMMISHVWKNPGDKTILMGTGREKRSYFLFIRFVSQDIELGSKE